MKLNKLVINYLKKQPKRAISLIISIILATALITTIGIISSSLKSNLIDDAKTNYGDYYATYYKLDTNKLNLIKLVGRFDKTGVSIPYGQFSNNKGTSLNIEACDKDSMKMLNIQLLQGSSPEKLEDICLDKWFLEEMKIPLKVGEKISLELSNGYEVNGKWKEFKFNKEFILKGIIKTNAGSKYSGTCMGVVNFDAAGKDLPK